jgi:hypothetical protein
MTSLITLGDLIITHGTTDNHGWNIMNVFFFVPGLQKSIKIKYQIRSSILMSESNEA